MRTILVSYRLGVFAVLFVAVLAFYFILVGETNRAQEPGKQEPGKRTSRFYLKDEITHLLRKPSTELVRIETDDDFDRRSAARVGTVIEDHGSFVVVAKEESKDLSMSGLGVQKVERTINLPASRFDPIKEARGATVTDRSDASSGKDYYIVQLGGTVESDSLQAIREMGGEIVQYIPHQAFFVRADEIAIARIADHSRVRWVGQYLPEDKVHPQLERVMSARSRGKSGTAQFDIAVFANSDLNEVQNELLGTTNGRVLAELRLARNYFNILRVELPISEISRVAQMKGVFAIEPYIPPQAEDERAAQIVAGNYTNTTTIAAPGYNPLSQFGVDGTNVTVAVVDDGVGIPGVGGFYVTANNAIDGPLRGATVGAAGHGHLQASIISGATPFSTLDPTGYNYGSGIAPGSHIVNIPLLRSGYSGSDAAFMHDTVTTAGPNGVLATISNNSWGSGTNGNSYDSFAAAFDGFVRDASVGGGIDPLTIIFSAGNSGANGLTRPKMSKNTIATAASKNLRSEIDGGATNMDDIASFSSRGPAADGRIKPDIAAPGQAITGGRSGDDVLFGNIDANHRWSSGTSHAAPQVAGAAALFTQYWKNATGVVPSPAVLKAAILLTGQEMNGLLATNPLPNGNEGWGRINLQYMLNTGVAMKYVDQDAEFSEPGQTMTYTGVVGDSSKPFRISLVWTDPPGTGNPALVNNLDLTVTVGDTVYRGNVFTGGLSVSGGSADTVNNVEQIRLPAGIAAGTPVTVEVRATALNGDGILGNADSTDQHFALVGYNFSEVQLAVYSVGGRVTDSMGRGIANAMVRLDDGNGSVRAATTNGFGYYRLDSVIGDASYTITPSVKRYGFTPQVVNVTGNLSSVDFVGN
ncbi:MAG: S8 family serine peptidase [Blastocatellia bacterium]|nr:S8 family serine peptidase [Blastocatellia bacterium]